MGEAQGCKYSALIVEPAELFFEAKEGSRFVPPRQDVFIKKAGPGLPASWDLLPADPLATWVTLRPNHGRGAKKVRFGVRPIGMAAGEYEVQIVPDSHVAITPSITVHLTVKGEPPSPPPPRIPCPYCKEDFASEIDLQIHVENDHFQYGCPHCEKKFNTVEQRDNHIKDEHSEPPPVFVCDKCGREFATEGELQQHLSEYEEPPGPEYNWLEKAIKWILDFFTGPFRSRK
jgi:DNA-directed RNA polymerase subunit M/transcription elongation factor TFIIS